MVGRKFGRNKRGVGVLGALIIGIFSLFVVAIIFSMLNTPFLTMMSTAENITNSSFSGDITITETLSKIKNTWTYLPLLVILVIIIFVIAQAVKPETHYE